MTRRQIIDDLKKEGLADLIIEGDDEIHTWRAVEKIKPDIICLGYDQKPKMGSLKM